MSLHPLLETSGLDPEHMQAMSITFAKLRRAMGVRLQEKARRELIARVVIEAARDGERDPLKLKACVLEVMKP